jgi:hypothetical protein
LAYCTSNIYWAEKCDSLDQLSDEALACHIEGHKTERKGDIDVEWHRNKIVSFTKHFFCTRCGRQAFSEYDTRAGRVLHVSTYYEYPDYYLMRNEAGCGMGVRAFSHEDFLREDLRRNMPEAATKKPQKRASAGAR